ncbi:MAG: selenocysteine-specific translation elongation factor [Acidimicrobiales bacterium]
MADGTHRGDDTSEVGAPARAAPPSRVVVTAGHVDHGKSTLVEWLTGTNPDRLEEEQRRGLTIDLGFASTMLASGIEVGIVDVPGHIRFLKNMVAGVGAVDACLFVVSATEGWKPQTEDHLRILDLVGVRHGVVALTYAAGVDDTGLELARDDVAVRVAGTFLEGAPVVAVDVPAGLGTDGPAGLRAALDEMVRTVPPASDRDRPRLWIDRSFAIRGAGAVVTGTLAGGTVRVGDRMDVVPIGAAAPIPVRVRGLESYGHRIELATPGRRLAVNLAGADRHAVARGAALVRAAQWHRSAVLDATLMTVPGLSHPVSHRGAYLAHLGTGEQAVRLRVVGGATEIAPGEAGTVRLWLSSTLPLAPGDRFVLRDAGRREVVGGGTVLDVSPVRSVARAAPSISVDRVVAERGWVDAQELSRLTGAPVTATLGRFVVDPDALAATRAAVDARVRDAGPTGLDVSLLDERERAVAATMGTLTVSHGIARLATSRDADLVDHPYLRTLRAAPFTPPPPDGVDRNDLRRLVRSGLVVETNGVWFAASALDDAARRVAALLEGLPDGVRVSDVRDVLGASRKYVLALLAYFDSSGITRRNGDFRSAGPNMPAPQPAGHGAMPAAPGTTLGEGGMA